VIDLRVGDCRTILATLPPKSVQCCVTSPPYFGLRDYGVDGQMGLEPTLAEYITGMVDVFRLVRDVLADDGTLWLNIGDSYWTDSPVRKTSGESFSKTWDTSQTASNGGNRRSAAKSGTFKNKDLMMVPARLAIALQDDGWYLRSDIIWHKPNPMPESVTDRPTSAHEHIFLLTKSARYYYNADAIRTEITSPTTKMPDGWDTGPGSHGAFHREGREKGTSTLTGGARKNPDRRESRGVEGKQRGHSRRHDGFNDRWDAMPKAEQQANGANARNVWSIATHPFPGAHFATFPPEIPRRCILAGSREGDTILDPFAGAGTTLLVADRLGRNGIGVELNPEYAQMARDRLYNDAPMFAWVSA